MPAEPSKPPGQQPADQQRAEQAEQRRVRRVRAAGQHERRRSGCRANAPSAKPGQRERARHEPLRPAEEGEQQHEADDDPVQAGHCTRAYRCGLRVR